MVLAGSLLGRPITAENTLQVHFIMMQRIARRIARVWRKRCLSIRIKALSNIAKYVADIDSNEVYLEQTMYLNLQDIYKKTMSPAWDKTNQPQDKKPTITPKKKHGKK